MRAGLLVLTLLIGTGCDQQTVVPTENANDSPQLSVNATMIPAEDQLAPTEAQVLPETPPEDPGLANLSPSRRRDYERGYRDCRNGEYNYDAQTQGEYYRIGCMAAENLKAGGGP